MSPSLLDTDTLSEIMKGRNAGVLLRAEEYLAEYGRFSFSLITEYEILRGLKAKKALKQLSRFEIQCQKSEVLPLTEQVVAKASDLYAQLRSTGKLISDADLLIAATALISKRVLVTNNAAHFQRIDGLTIESWSA